MPAVQPWCYLMGIEPQKLTREENILLEAEIFTRVCEEMKGIFREKHNDFFRLMKYTMEMENTMLETDFLRLVIFDILSTDEYNIKGIAYYTNTHEDVLQELIAGINNNPSVTLFKKIIELHRTVRRELYQVVMKKIMSGYLGPA